MNRILCSLLVLGLVQSGSVAAAQGAAQSNCSGLEARQFDFWVGSWNVTEAGKEAGTNEITLEENGCVLHEHWTGTRGSSTGQSFNFFDRTSSKWHQFWVDNGGNHLDLTGTYSDGKLVLTGEAPGPDGKPADQRLTFFKNADGSVRQLWETSSDRGVSWQVAFDGLYRRR